MTGCLQFSLGRKVILDSAVLDEWWHLQQQTSPKSWVNTIPVFGDLSRHQTQGLFIKRRD